MATTGYYYLHTNGTLLFKHAYLDGAEQEFEFRESPFAVMFWKVDAQRREDMWRVLIEALALGGEPQGITKLANMAGCNDHDAKVYAERIGVRVDSPGSAFKWGAITRRERTSGMNHTGFGGTALEAMADLCKNMGYRANKVWPVSFEQLVRG